MTGPEVIVVGAGQGGLSTSYFLTCRGVEHVVLERGVVGDSWSRRRWDSFCLVTPNWSIRLPGAGYDGPDPDGFMLRDALVAYLERWTEGFGCPVRTGVAVTGIRPGNDGRLLVHTSAGPMSANAVVVATGTMQAPRRPAMADRLSRRLVQVDAESYRNPADLPAGAVLVVGSGQTGCQIADDLRLAGRRVLLSVGGAGRVPRRYRGRDCIAWLLDLGYFDRTPDMLESPAQRFRAEAQASGRDGGRTISLHDFHRDGVGLLGKITGADGETVTLAGNLRRDMAEADAFARQFCDGVDAFVSENDMDAPPPTEEDLEGGPPAGRWSIPEAASLDLQAEGVTTVVWATGFTYDFSWIKFPVRDEMGYPVTDRGATNVPGLYFIGLNWMVKRKSGLLYGVGEDARHVADHIVSYLGARS